MKTMDFYNKIAKIRQQDHRYSSEAYEFVSDAVLFAVEKYQKKGRAGHISAGELLDGIKEFALVKFGPMAYTVFSEWGVIDSSAIGNIVFNMIDQGILTSSKDDSIEDFENAIDFKTEFRIPFLPNKEATRKAIKIV